MPVCTRMKLAQMSLTLCESLAESSDVNCADLSVAGIVFGNKADDRKYDCT